MENNGFADRIVVSWVERLFGSGAAVVGEHDALGQLERIVGD